MHEVFSAVFAWMMELFFLFGLFATCEFASSGTFSFPDFVGPFVALWAAALSSAHACGPAAPLLLLAVATGSGVLE